MLRKIDESQLAQAFSEDLSSDLPGEDCPSAEQLWQTCTLELDLETRQAIIDHCISCPHCAQEMRITREMVAEHNELLVGESANSVGEGVAMLSMVESGAASPLRIVQDAPAEPANDLAQDGQSKIVSLGTWRRRLNKVTAGCGVLAIAAALAFFVSKKSESGPSQGAWRGQDAQSQTGPYRFSKGIFSWPAMADAEQYELEIMGAKGSRPKCIQTLSTNSFALDPAHCPELRPSEPFFWRVRAVSKQGEGTFSRYFAVKGSKAL